MAFYTDEQLSMILSANEFIQSYWAMEGIFDKGADQKMNKYANDVEEWLSVVTGIYSTDSYYLLRELIKWGLA